jgi:hypothetical protein
MLKASRAARRWSSNLEGARNFKVRFGEPPKPAPEPGALPRKQKRPAEAGRFE